MLLHFVILMELHIAKMHKYPIDIFRCPDYQPIPFDNPDSGVKTLISTGFPKNRICGKACGKCA